MKCFTSISPRPTTRWLGFMLAALFATAAQGQTNLSLSFASPATNASYGASFDAGFTYAPGGSTITAFITNGSSVASATTNASGGSGTITLTPDYGQTGKVDVLLRRTSTGSTNELSFTVNFRGPSSNMSLTPGFTTPVTNSTPGAAYTANFTFTPANEPARFNLAVNSATISPQPAISITTNLAAGTVAVTFTPSNYNSGTLSATLYASNGFTTANSAFTVVFKSFPPSIAPVAPQNMDEDTTNVVAYYVSDPDTPAGSLTYTASSSNTNLIDNAGMTLGGSGTNRTVTLIPKANMNGVANITLGVSDGVSTGSTIFALTVNPQPDPPVISGLTNITVSSGDGAFNILPTVTISDADEGKPSTTTQSATVTISPASLALFQNNDTTYQTNGTPAQVTAALRALQATPIISGGGVPGSSSPLSVNLSVNDGVLSTNASSIANIEVVNSPPDLRVFLTPTNVVEGTSVQPFRLEYLSDVDLGDDNFTLEISITNPAQAALGTITPTNRIVGNETTIRSQLESLSFNAASGVLTTSTQEVEFTFEAFDGFGTSSVERVSLQVTQIQTPPVISGIPLENRTINDRPVGNTLFPTVFVSDSDSAGTQPVRAIVSANPALGTFSTNSTPLLSQGDLVTLLRSLQFTPAPGLIPIGGSSNTLITLTVFDEAGLSVQNNNLTLNITGVNNAPQFPGFPEASQQPVLIPPGAILLPFADINLTSDDTNDVFFSLSIDDTDKGTLSNLGAFAQSGTGIFTMSGSTASILSSLTNITYHLNPGYIFPPSDPGGTTFTLSARDYAFLTSTVELYIQVQGEPRHHLVSRALNDGLPGSFTYALSQAGNGDVITFALPSYPAVVRMPGSQTTNINRNITIKGPGANLLTISGDNNGDNVPDRQIFQISASVVIEGITLARGTANYGGAVQVLALGQLTLIQSAVVDSEAVYYGGGIDVNEGRLNLQYSFIGRNRVSADNGNGGGGISIYTTRDITIEGSTFAENVQANSSGDGGGAIMAENSNPGAPMNLVINHSTFAGNIDEAGQASSIYAINEDVDVIPSFSIFADGQGRNLEVAGNAEFISSGGNVSDDSTQTSFGLGGSPGAVFLLDHVNDLTDTAPLLAELAASGDPTPYFELLPGSPAINLGLGSSSALDQRGVLRTGIPDAGAFEFGALGRLVMNEIYAGTGAVHYVELYVRRDSTPVDLANYNLLIDGEAVHAFKTNIIVGQNDIFTAGTATNAVVRPGFGMTIAFSDTPVSITGNGNANPVIKPSIAPTNRIPERSVITLATDAGAIIARQSILLDYLDPANGTNLLDVTDESIALAPQFRGFALIPHSYVQNGPFDGGDFSQALGTDPQSPNEDAAGTPFGQDNALPLALANVFTVTEDDLANLDVLANDYDSDASDRLVIVDVSTATGSGSGDAGSASSALGANVTIEPAGSPLRGSALHFDPRTAVNLQQLPVATEIIDTFFYEIIDIGSAPLASYKAGTAPGTVEFASVNHRLSNGVQIVISGSSQSNYNSTFSVTVVDEDNFAIPASFSAGVTNLGTWSTTLPRSPTSRSEAPVSVRVLGVNDAPVAGDDVVSGVTERSVVRVMTRPELAGSGITFPSDPSPAPVMLATNLLSNDDDIDTDDDWTDLRVVGIMGSVNAISGYTGVTGSSPVSVQATAHGLTSGDSVLIANYGGHPSYNGYHTVTVIDDDTFTIPRTFVDDATDKGVWVTTANATATTGSSDVGASLTLITRVDVTEDHLIYDASASSFLQGLAEGELYTNRIYYTVRDRNGASGIGAIDVVVSGVNHAPQPQPDPGSLNQLAPLASGTNTIASILGTGLDYLYSLPAASGGSNQLDVNAVDLSGNIAGILTLNGVFAADEDTLLAFAATNLTANDSDIDRIDTLTVISVDSVSREGAPVSLAAGTISYDPRASTNLQALMRNELLVDSFEAVISDGATGGNVTSLVAVLVTGVNDTPVANPVNLITHENEVLVFDPRTNDVEVDINGRLPDDKLTLIAVTNVTNPGLAPVDITSTSIMHNATLSDLLNELDAGESFTNTFTYTVRDDSFLLAVDDTFSVLTDSGPYILPVLANDRDYIPGTGTFTIVEAGPAGAEGTVTVASNGLSVIYTPPFSTYAGLDHFRYIIRNAEGAESRARVLVRLVEPELNGTLRVANDYFAVAKGEIASMDVLANDGNTPGAGSGLTITRLISTSLPGQPVLTNNTFVYEASSGPSQITFTYEATAGGTSLGQATAVLEVYDLSGTLQVQDDTFHVLAGSFANPLPVLANDGLLGENNDHFRIRSITGSANYGSLTTNATGTGLIYTPDDDFIGTEQVQYLATDGLGQTGSGTVSIVVGHVEVLSDFYTVPAATNLPVILDVLENDRMLSNLRGSLSIVSVSPLSSAIGTIAVGGTSNNLVFTPNFVTGQTNFSYVVEDRSSPPRVVTGVVTVASVPNGTYANPDRYAVRGNGQDYVLDVLVNDVGFPAAGKVYSITGIGTGADAPNQGGIVMVMSNRLVYTPAEGFTGEESFTYTMADSDGNDSTLVTVSVRPGDLNAAPDRFAVYYETEPGTNVIRSFSLPALNNDAIQPPLDQVLSISAIGVGANAPNQGGQASVTSGGQSITYRPVAVPVTPYIEQFTYEVSDGAGRLARSTVEVLVRNRASNLVAVTHADAFAVSRNSTGNVLNVLANDAIQPANASGWTITSVSSSSAGATITIVAGTLRYTPPTGFTGRDTFSYAISDGLGGTGNTTVEVQVGSLPVVDDEFVVVANTTSNLLDVLINDPLATNLVSEYTLLTSGGADQGGAVAVSGNHVAYTPAASYSGLEFFTYTVQDDSGQVSTGSVRVLVLAENADRSTALVTLVVEGRDEPYTNAYPQAVNDTFTVKEDDTATLFPLANDTDADGNDRLVIVDISTTSSPGSGSGTNTTTALGAPVVLSPVGVPLKGTSVSYDPRTTQNLQQLPVGVEIEDTFFYEIIDYGSAAIEMYEDGGTGTTRVHATNHRLTNGAQVVISGATNAAYNGTFTIGVSVVSDDIFTIPVAYAGDDEPRGAWEDETPRYPSDRDEGQFTVRVIGVNDPPVGVLDVITNVTERETKRLMVRPELATTDYNFPGDPTPAPATLLNQDILSNDTDIDTDDEWSDLRVVGVMSNVNVITGYSGTPGTNPVTVTSTGHGLSSGDEILIANYGGHVSYNGYHTVIFVDDDTFTIPRFFVDDHAEKGVWVILNDANRYNATTDVGATVSLTLRTDPQEDHLIYNAFSSSFLQGLAEGEKYTNRFYYAVRDRNDGYGIGAIDMIIDGVNNTPVANDDPDDINKLDPLIGGTNTLDNILAHGIDPMYILPPTSGSNGLVNLQLLDLSGTVTGTVVIGDIWMTDEDTSINIPAASLLTNDTDVDRTDILNVISVDTFSREGAALNLAAGLIAFNPAAASNLQALARGEYLVDSFDVLVSDGFTAGTVTSTVAVLVVGVNDSPTAVADYRVTHEDEVVVWDTRTNDVEIDINAYDPDDQLRIIVETNVVNPGQAHVYFTPTSIIHDATTSFFLQQLADFHHPLPVNQSFTNVFSYTVSDNSFLFATDDQFDIPFGGEAAALAVLLNDRDFTPDGAPFAIIDAGPALFGGIVTISSNAQFVIYQAPTNHLGPDYFRYTIENANGSKGSALVSVRSVDPKRNGILQAADDFYMVAAGQTLVMNVIANDGVEGQPATPVITRIVSSSIPGQPVLTNNTFVYAPDTVAPLSFRYEISAGGTALAEANVTVEVVERRGTLLINDDAFSVPVESTDNRLPVLANDGELNRSIAGLVLDSIAVAPSNGTATVDAGTGEVVYTPNAGFAGIDTIHYLAADGVGGTGTGVLRVTVGLLETATDYFTVLAGGPATVLDVLNNDRMVGAGLNNLRITGVTPASSAVGSIIVSTNGTDLVFTPGGTTGQGLFDYVVEDASVPPRSATVRVTIDTVSNGTYANADRYIVRGGGSNYLLEVLANDVSFPASTSQVIAAIGGGAGDPDQGGSVSISGDRIAYSPVPGFFGEESFEYTLSDGVTTDVTRVTVSVRRGDLLPGDDHYAVIYETPPFLPTEFTLPVLSNDRIIPELGQAVTLNILGTGTNAPSQGGSLSIAPNGTELVYRPVAVPSPGYTETFTYEITDGAARRASARVFVKVGLRPYLLDAQVRDDDYTVAYNSTGVVMSVLANDGAKPASASGWTITSVDATTSQGGAASISGSTIVYSAPAGFVGEDSFTYQVVDGVGGTGGASVTVRVGNMPVVDDRFTVISSNEVFVLDVIGNDLHLNPHTDKYIIRSVTNISDSGTVSISISNQVLYTPDQSYSGDYPYTATFDYTVHDDSLVASTARVSVIVHEANSDRSTAQITLLVEGRNDAPVITNDVTPFVITDKQTIRPFLAVDFTEIDEQLFERVDVTVAIDDPVKGSLSDLASFVDLGGGVYALTNTTAAGANAAISNMLYTPVENRITVPTMEPAYFTITITDNKSAPVVNTNTIIEVTATNDPVQVSGVRGPQSYYYRSAVAPFDLIRITEVDDLALQPLTVTVTMVPATNGLLENVSSFEDVGSGQFRATNITAAAAQAELRAMQFRLRDQVSVAVGSSLNTTLQLTVDDGFADPVQDNSTVLTALNGYEGMVRPAAANLQPNFGFSVDTGYDWAIAGAPLASPRGANSGAALIYRLNEGTPVSWTEWRTLTPLQTEAGDEFGYAVAMDGTVAAVSAIRDEVTGGATAGAVYLFELDEGGTNNWGQISRIAGDGLAGNALFGRSVALSGDLLAIGAPDADLAGSGLKPGAVFLYQRDPGTNTWREIMRWAPTNTAAANAQFGWDVALDGEDLMVGAYEYNATGDVSVLEGAVFHFNRDQGGAGQWGVVDVLSVSGSRFMGLSLDVEDGLLAVGASAMTVNGIVNAGLVYLFEKNPGTGRYAFSQSLERSADNVRRFGSDIAIDQGRMLIGAQGLLSASYPGNAYLFEREASTSTVWQVVEKLSLPAGSAAGNYGQSVGFNQGVGIIGATVTLSPINNNGYAYLYRFEQNRAPAPLVTIADQDAEVGEPFSFTLPSDMFVDNDRWPNYIISMAFPDGSNGLALVNGILTGTPQQAGSYEMVVQATDNGNATGGISFQVVVARASSPYVVWEIQNFGQFNAGDPYADPDGDGMVNLAEYAFMTDPIVAEVNAGGLSLTITTNGHAVVSYERRANDPELEFTLEFTEDMEVWMDVPLVDIQTAIKPGSSLSASLYELTVPPPAGQRVAGYRISVQR